ncbi:MAG: uL15 family ribosomal protein [Thaumarchaeota archaeon]|nr:uL15 family ribosomal protein [Nitrososphaerota archaeon]
MGTRHRKSRKHRGSRTCGWGQIGQHRKSGSRGGHGHAGMHKHKWTWVLKYAPDYFGKHGFHRPNKREIKAINLIQLTTLLENFERRGELKLVEGMPLLNLAELGIGKLVAGGKLDRKVLVVVERWTEKAEKAIKEAGGKIISPKELQGVAS